MVPLIFDLLSTKVAGWFQNVEDIIKSWGELLKKFVAAWRVYLLKLLTGDLKMKKNSLYSKIVKPFWTLHSISKMVQKLYVYSRHYILKFVNWAPLHQMILRLFSAFAIEILNLILFKKHAITTSMSCSWMIHKRTR